MPTYERAFVSAFPVARSSASTFAPELISIFCATTLPDKIAVEAKLTFMAAIGCCQTKPHPSQSAMIT